MVVTRPHGCRRDLGPVRPRSRSVGL